jgi:lycopene cyclase domain-containing protein
VIENVAWLYLGALLFSLGGLTALDWRYRLSFFRDAKLATKQALITFAAFLVIDYAALSAGSFVEGTSSFQTGIFLPGRLPIEEPLFLLLLIYSAMILSAAFVRARGNK